MKLLERHFEIALETPDGITKLRELILSLAMKGKLVPQNPKDKSASELLKEIEAEKKKLIKEGKIKKQEPLQLFKNEDIPYELPYGWVWTNLFSLGEINPRNEADDKLIVAFIPMPLIFSEYGKKHSFEERKWGEIKKGFTHFAENDVVLAKITPCFENGKSCVIKELPNGIGAGTTELHVFRNSYGKMCPEYILAFLKNPRFISDGIPKMTGSAGQKRVPRNYFSYTPFPLPPLAEQKRIVVKIDQLMALCDKLEAERNERDKKRLILHTAAMNRLITAADKKAFNTSWSFINKNFSKLYSVSKNVEDLKKAILQLAVMGKLVPQDPNDQPASELLKEIEAEKKKLIKQGKIKKQEPLPLIKPEEIPYALPLGWVWVRFGMIAQHNSGKTLDSSRNKGELRDYITTSNLYWGYFVLNNVRQMPIKEDELDKCTAKKGDLLICEGGEAGRAAVWNYENEICFQNHIHRVRFYLDINPYYAYRFFEKLNRTGEIDNYRKGVAISNMSGKTLASIIFPLPPRAEQKRVVAKIDQLMDCCNTLEQQIKDSTEKQTAILDAVLARL